jgi:hypothetical protein
MIAKVRQVIKVPKTYASDAPQHIINCINRGGLSLTQSSKKLAMNSPWLSTVSRVQTWFTVANPPLRFFGVISDM